MASSENSRRLTTRVELLLLCFDLGTVYIRLNDSVVIESVWLYLFPGQPSAQPLFQLAKWCLGTGTTRSGHREEERKTVCWKISAVWAVSGRDQQLYLL